MSEDVNSSSDPGPEKRDRYTPKRDFLFVVTYGRSGSTLVQGLLNGLPGTMIRGENNFFILPLFRAWDALSSFYLRHHEDVLANHGSRWAFFGLDEVTLDEFVLDTRGLVVQQLIGSKRKKRKNQVKILGFKEIRWYQIEQKETKRFFEFFEQVFPGARYVLNQRDHAQVVSSGFWQQQESDEVLAALRRVEEIQEFLRQTRPDRTYVVRYELVTSSDPAVVDRELRSMADFVLGEYDDAVIAGMKERMEKGHGPRPFGKSRDAEAPADATDPSPPAEIEPDPAAQPAPATARLEQT